MSDVFTVVGAGAWGRALTSVLLRNGEKVCLWDKFFARNLPDKSILNDANLTTQELENLVITEDLEFATQSCSSIVIVIPSSAFPDFIPQLKSFVLPRHNIVVASKGFIPNTQDLLLTYVKQELGSTRDIAVLSGPSFAKEVMEQKATCVMLASENKQFANLMQSKFSNESFSLYATDDVVGVQIGGACKNVIAILVGILDGMKYGANSKAAIINFGLQEIVSLAKLFGATDPKAIYGLAGIGDLLLTCNDNLSRNRRFGMFVGEGMSCEDASNKVQQTIEGLDTVKSMHDLVKKFNLQLPITEAVYDIIYNQQSCHDAVPRLFTSLKTW
ncbi:MAG: NAD(P)-dependent glycerol-3-phosphate dehydrogenase [Alcanivoracaceae bacterium]|nr:NAD(P)-dependent glycerol-3-phosphate dehydrogenase [Alcanivoracaceae bacterium]